MGWSRAFLVLVFIVEVLSVNSDIFTTNLVQDSFKEILEELETYESKCATQIGYMFVGENYKNGWPLKMLDSWSKIPSGLLSGNIADLGAFDQCIGIEEEFKNEVIKGNYCKVNIPLKSITDKFPQLNPTVQSRGAFSVAKGNAVLSLAICLPNACSAEEINDFFQKSTITKNLTISVANCQSNDPESFNAGDWTALVLFAVLTAVIICSTCYDIYIQKTEKSTFYNLFSTVEPGHLILIAFSWYTHGKKLVSVTNNPDQLTCLHGVRFISMMWVIVGHTYYGTFFSPTVNALDISQWIKNYSSMYILGATLSVDTFFVLGGLLMSYVYLSAKDKGIKFNIIMFYIHRYIRLTPALGAVVLLHVTLLRFFGSGPYWPEVMQNLEMNCSKYWWSTLLYVQNYVNVREMCLGQSWYLSVDMQIFIVSPFVLIPLGLWPKITIPLLWCLTVISMIIPFTIAYIYEMPGLMTEAIKNKDYTSMYYNNTYTRFGPVVVGIILGYYIYHRKVNTRINSLFKITLFNISGWIISVVSMFLIVFEENNMYNHDYNQIESSFYLGVHRVAWSFALCWVIYACVIGHGGIVNAFLSLPIFQILSRLTYSMYLIHLSLMAMRIGLLRVPIYFSNYNNMYNFWGDFCFTVATSVIWTLAFESPMITIEKIIFKNAVKKPEKKLSKVMSQS